MFHEVDQEPIESFNIETNGDLRKCFTFFSALSQMWRNFKIKLDEIKIGFFQKNSWVPANRFFGYHLAINSPNSLPRFEPDGNFITLVPNIEH